MQTMELICLSKFKPGSKITPRCLAWEFAFNVRGPRGLIVELEQRSFTVKIKFGVRTYCIMRNNDGM